MSTETNAIQVPARPGGWAAGFALPPKWTVSRWADEKRHIAAGTGPEPGRWRTDRTPYLREPMDCVTDPEIETLVLMMSSQVGKTEVIVNIAGYFIDQDPAPQLLVLPTLELADSFSTKRFQPTIDASPALSDKVGTHFGRDTSVTIREKSYPGGDLVFAGANSPASLASRPRRVVMFDEIDKYKVNIGADGDPIKQGFQRTQNFWNRRKILASTPTIEGASAIAEWWSRSDQRLFMCPCHACKKFQALEWERVDWPEKETPAARPAEAFYHCADCGAVWDQRQLWRAVADGHWEAQRPFNGVAGFHVWAIYSPWVTMADLAAEWETCHGKPAEEQTFVNLKLGRPFNPSKAAQTTPEILHARREDYSPNKPPHQVPADVLAITAGVDVQGNRFEVTYLGWGDHDEKWVLHHAVHYDDPTDPRAWERFESLYLTRTFRHPAGQEMYIEAICFDTGHLSQVVMDFVRTRRAAFKNYFAIKGVEGEGRGIITESDQKFRLGAKLYLVGVDDGKTTLYQELASVHDPNTQTGVTRVHFPSHLEIDYFRQLVAERVMVVYVAGRPKRKWVPGNNRRNEALDCFVYAMAARYKLSLDYADRRVQLTNAGPRRDLGDVAALFKPGA